MTLKQSLIIVHKLAIAGATNASGVRGAEWETWVTEAMDALDEIELYIKTLKEEED